MIKPHTTIGVIDYGAGNIENVVRAFDYLGFSSKPIKLATELKKVSHAVIPGVGSFRFGMEKLEEAGFPAEIQEFTVSGRPILGICLGMQLMATKGFEHGETLGLNLFPGVVVEMEFHDDSTSKSRVPHTGWARVESSSDVDESIFVSGDYYFSHSFHLVPENRTQLVGGYFERAGTRVVAAFGNNGVFGTQFHPEKSGELGLQTLKRFGML